MHDATDELWATRKAWAMLELSKSRAVQINTCAIKATTPEECAKSKSRSCTPTKMMLRSRQIQMMASILVPQPTYTIAAACCCINLNVLRAAQCSNMLQHPACCYSGGLCVVGCNSVCLQHTTSSARTDTMLLECAWQGYMLHCTCEGLRSGRIITRCELISTIKAQLKPEYAANQSAYGT